VCPQPPARSLLASFSRWVVPPDAESLAGRGRGKGEGGCCLVALLACDDERLAARLKIMEAETRSALAKIRSDIHAQHGAALYGGGGFGGGGGGRAVREEGTQEDRGHDHLQALEEQMQDRMEQMQDRMAEMQDRAADKLEEQLQAFEALLRKHGGSPQPTDLSPSQSVQPPAGPESANTVGDLIRELERKISGKFQLFESKLSSKLEVQMQQLEEKLGDEMQQVSPSPMRLEVSPSPMRLANPRKTPSAGLSPHPNPRVRPRVRPCLAGAPKPCQA
jgi:hypothetical protein